MKKSIHRMTSVVEAVALLSGQMFASSHSDAPLSKQDPQTNLADVYAFIGGNGNLNFIINVRPFGEPGDGVLHDRFADDAMYTINIANPATGALLRSYNFQFSPVSSAAGNYKNKATALSHGSGTTIGAIQDIGDSNQNLTQTYSVTMVDAATGTSTVLGSGLIVPPVNVGLRTTPFYNDPNTGFAISGATAPQSLDKYTMEAVFTAPTGEKMFASKREDSFFCDIPCIFDLINPRILGPDGHGQTGNGVDGFKGFNVLTFVIQVPLANLPAPITYTDAFSGASHGLGVLSHGEPSAHHAAERIGRLGQFWPVDSTEPPWQSIFQRTAGGDPGQGQLQPRLSDQ